MAISLLLTGHAVHSPCSMLHVALPPRKLHTHVSLRSKMSDRVPIIFACEPSVILLTRCVTSVSMTFGALNHVLTLRKRWLMKQHCCNGIAPHPPTLCLTQTFLICCSVRTAWLRNRERHCFKVTSLCPGDTPSYQEVLRTCCKY